MGLGLKFFVFSISLCLLFTFPVPLIYALGNDDAAVVISTADTVLGVAFEAILEAERSGADVSNLLDRISLGGEYLDEANFMYRMGLYEDAVHFADLCIETVNDVQEEAAELVKKAEFDLTLMLFLSILALIIVAVTSFICWRIFRRQYREQSFGLKVEVLSCEY